MILHGCREESFLTKRKRSLKSFCCQTACYLFRITKVEIIYLKKNEFANIKGKNLNSDCISESRVANNHVTEYHILIALLVNWTSSDNLYSLALKSQDATDSLYNRISTLNAAIGLENRYRQTRPLDKKVKKIKNKRKGKICQFGELEILCVKQEHYVKNNLFPEGGTEHTRTAPARYECVLFISETVYIRGK